MLSVAPRLLVIIDNPGIGNSEKHGYFYGCGTQDMKMNDAIPPRLSDYIAKTTGRTEDLVLALTADKEGGSRMASTGC